MAKKPETDIAAEVVKFFQEREGAEDESQNRQQMTDDLRFCYVPGAQWDEETKKKRQGRPCYSYNRTVGAVNRAIGDQRQSSPSCTVRAVNKKGSVEVADTFAGLIRDIEAQSAAEDVYDEAFKYAVAGAWGAWRVVPEYADDESFDQVLRIKRIPNPQTVYFDGGADPYGRGARRCVVAERISNEVYEATYGDEPYKNLPASRDSHGWINQDGIRIAEYYKMGTREKEIALLSDGRVMPWSKEAETELATFNAEEGTDVKVERKRKVQETFVTWYKVDGMRVLEGPIEYKYRHIPVIRCPGRHVNIEGQQYFQSMITHAKDAQRTYNFERSSMLESVAGTPDSPYLVTAKMIKGYENQWNSANAVKRPYLVYDPDDKAVAAGGKPFRERPPDVPAALIALSQQSAEDIKQTTGYVNPALDQPQVMGPESGVALRNRMMGGDSESYEFLDQLAKAIKFTWEICIDMIPVHYDTERVVRILGEDKKEQFVTVNGEDEDGVKRMLREGKYDVTVTLGPAYATQRLESLDTLLEATERMPIIGEVAPDIIIRNMDVRGADEIEKRVRKRLIASGVAEPTKEEQAEMGPPPPPDPAQVALTERLEAQTAKDRASAAKTQVETAEKMAQASSAERRESLELEQIVKEIAHQQAETMLLLKQFIQRDPGETSARANL